MRDPTTEAIEQDPDPTSLLFHLQPALENLAKKVNPLSTESHQAADIVMTSAETKGKTDRGIEANEVEDQKLGEMEASPPQDDEEEMTEAKIGEIVRGMDESDLRLLDWHWANLEYGCSARLKDVSLAHWNQVCSILTINHSISIATINHSISIYEWRQSRSHYI